MIKNLAKLTTVSTLALFLSGCFAAKSINQDANSQPAQATEAAQPADVAQPTEAAQPEAPAAN